MSDEKLIQRIVAEVVRRLKALEGGAVSAPIDPPVSLVTEDLVKSVIKSRWRCGLCDAQCDCDAVGAGFDTAAEGASGGG